MHRTSLYLSLCVSISCLLNATFALAQAPSFTAVGDLPGGAIGSAAFDVSADGSVVVGESEGSNGTEGFVWTSGGGIVGIGFLSLAEPFSSALGVSENGSVIVGSSHDSDGVPRAFRYSSSTMTALNRFSCDSCEPVSRAYGVSGDGLVVVGSSLGRSGGSSAPHLDPVRWPGGGTGISDLGDLSGGEDAGEAFGASPNGSIIVGSHSSGNGKDAWYWTGSGLNALPTITGGAIIAATALAVSDDGSTIVGYSNQGTLTLPGGTVVATDSQAVRWTGASYSTLQQLGAYPGAVAVDSQALAVTADGSIIVGRAADASLSDRAFIWDATNGMRDLKTVLTDVYGLNTVGWVLSEATGISDVVGGEFSIVGHGINPQGDPEGWRAFLSLPACSDGVNNDADAFTDYPADPECNSATDWSEENDCEDGIDNDEDGDADFPTDAGCLSLADPTEEPDCADGLDNDGDAQTDFPSDPGCANAQSRQEDPACSDGIDNEPDGDTDFPADDECVAAWDLSEVEDCNDGLDNDGDGFIDAPADPECASASDPSEASQCSDGIDNDGDGLTDYPEQQLGCISVDDPIEAPQCSDGVDNDIDTQIDFPNDTSCSSADGISESLFSLTEGDLIVVDRKSRVVFRVDRSTGAQTLLSEKALMQAPQGIDVRGLELVVADPSGLVAISSSSLQRLASPPLSANDSLQVVFDAVGAAFVLESDQISKLAWNYTGIGVKTTFLAVPTPELFPVLQLWNGDALAIEQNGDLLTSGLSIYGAGAYRVDAITQTPALLDPGARGMTWFDLAVEDDQTILAVGIVTDQGIGIYRVDPGTGAVTPLNESYGWQLPSGVAVATDDQIYVADSGVCADGACSGGQIVHVNPVSGAATVVSTGGYIQGEMDLVLVPEPDSIALLISGVAGIILLNQRRSSRAR